MQKSGQHAVEFNWAILFFVKHNLVLEKNSKEDKYSQYKCSWYTF